MIHIRGFVVGTKSQMSDKTTMNRLKERDKGVVTCSETVTHG